MIEVRTNIDDVRLLTLDELHALPTNAPNLGAGLYFLWDQFELLYIGMARNIQSRVFGHTRARMGFRKGKVIPFSTYTYLIWEENNWRSEVETRYIMKFRPPYNEKIA